MDWIRFDKRGVLFKHKLSNVKIRWLCVGNEGTAHDNTFKNLKNCTKQLLQAPLLNQNIQQIQTKEASNRRKLKQFYAHYSIFQQPIAFILIILLISISVCFQSILQSLQNVFVQIQLFLKIKKSQINIFQKEPFGSADCLLSLVLLYFFTCLISFLISKENLIQLFLFEFGRSLFFVEEQVTRKGRRMQQQISHIMHFLDVITHLFLSELISHRCLSKLSIFLAIKFIQIFNILISFHTFQFIVSSSSELFLKLLAFSVINRLVLQLQWRMIICCFSYECF